MTDNKENANGEFGLTNSNCYDKLNIPEDLKGDNPSEEGLSFFIGENDWVHGFSKGDVVWYYLDSWRMEMRWAYIMLIIPKKRL